MNQISKKTPPPELKGDDMDYKNILLLIFISSLLIGTVCAQKTVNDFKIDESYSKAYNGVSSSLYLNQDHDSGITVYKYLADDDNNNDAYDDLIHDEGKDYLTPDDDFKIDKNSDNTANFTDIDHSQHGVVELVKCDGEDFVVVFWAKDSSNVNNADLISKLNEFNHDNNVSAIAF